MINTGLTNLWTMPSKVKWRVYASGGYNKNPLKYLYWYTIGKTIKNFEEPFLWVVMFGIDIEWLYAQHYLLLLLGFLGFAGMAFSGRKNHIMKLPAYTVLLFNCVHLPFYCFSRYMFPFMFCFALYAAYLIAGLFALLKIMLF